MVKEKDVGIDAEQIDLRRWVGSKFHYWKEGTPLHNENREYQAVLLGLAQRQVSLVRSGKDTYKAGTDFITNQPIFRQINGTVVDSRSAWIDIDLIESLEEESFLKHGILARGLLNAMYSKYGIATRV